jgi:hypothetical protein
MLLSKTAIVKWNNKTKYHYIEKGYIFTKIGDEFEVKINDLTKGSIVKIELQCDYCNKKFTRTYGSYINLKEKSINDKDSCQKCAHNKAKEFYLLTYGVEHNTKLDDYKESRKKNIEEIKDALEKRNFTLISSEYVYCTEKLEFICNEHKEEGSQFLSWTQFNRGFGCKFCGYERISEHHKGENNPNWKGGTTPLHFILRDRIKEWKKNSLEKYNYSCALSGLKENLEIHHLYGFNLILEELQYVINIDLSKELIKYSDEEKEIINNEFDKLHIKYGLGVPLNKDIHKLFHDTYGRGDNTPDQFEEFKFNYLNNIVNFEGGVGNW